MRFLLFLALLLPLPAAAQLVAPLTLPDGRIACTQGKTGAGRVTDWEAVPDPSAPGGWALSETAGDATDLRFALCISEQTVARDVDATLRFKAVGGSHPGPPASSCAPRAPTTITSSAPTPSKARCGSTA